MRYQPIENHTERRHRPVQMRKLMQHVGDPVKTNQGEYKRGGQAAQEYVSKACLLIPENP